ncbi:MAG: hypothetical protein JWQ57_1888 [Mucilaginibacter sp.]|nr:hypothetical protein [Mucilaginibacter sp.]
MKYLLTLVIVFALSACGGKNKPDNPTPPISKAVLVAPAQDAACNTGTVIATNKVLLPLNGIK